MEKSIPSSKIRVHANQALLSHVAENYVQLLLTFHQQVELYMSPDVSKTYPRLLSACILVVGNILNTDNKPNFSCFLEWFILFQRLVYDGIV